MKAVMAHFERLGTIMVADREHHCVFHFDVAVTETEQLVFNSHSCSAIILCGNMPASALDRLVAFPVRYVVSDEPRSQLSEQGSIDQGLVPARQKFDHKMEEVRQFPTSPRNAMPIGDQGCFAKCKVGNMTKDLVLVLRSNNHGFLKIKVLSLMMPWMTSQGERQVSRSQRHFEHAREFLFILCLSDIHKTFGMDEASVMLGKVTTKPADGMKLFQHSASQRQRGYWEKT